MPERWRPTHPVRPGRARAADNLRSGPPRLFGVAEGDTWEREVRRSLADQAADVPPSGTDLAGVAIARGRAARRRRAGLALAAVAVGTLLAAGTVLHGTQGGEPGAEYGAASGPIEEGARAMASADPGALESPPIDETGAVEPSADAIGDADGDGRVRATRTGGPWTWA